MNNNLFEQGYNITKEQRNASNKHKSLVVWFTGLSGSGKSFLANALEKHLYLKGIKTYTLDGDNIRLGINSDLGFSKQDREENLRRIAHIGSLMTDAGIVCLAAFVSPLEENRLLVKSIIGKDNFFEIYVNTPIAVCEKRDVKGLYEKARKGEIKDFTGVNAPFEAPENPDVTIDTSIEDVSVSVQKIFNLVYQNLKM